MATTNHIQMEFLCNQKWEHMKASENGRFCDRCKHEVFDFSDMSIEQIRAIKEKKNIRCGNFRVEQTEDLTPIEFSSLKKTKYWIATITTFFGLEIGKVQAQHYRPEVKCEITGQCSDSSQTGEIHIKKAEPEEPIPIEEPSRKVTLGTIGKYNIYRSKKFPFIKLRKRFVRGNLRSL